MASQDAERPFRANSKGKFFKLEAEMRYLSNLVVAGRGGEPLPLRWTEKGEPREVLEPTIGQVLYRLLDSYLPSQALTLTPSQLRRYNRLLDILEAAPTYYSIEEADWDLLKLYVEGYLPQTPAARYLPYLMDALDRAGTVPPDAERVDDVAKKLLEEK